MWKENVIQQEPLEQRLDKMEIRGRIETIQATALLKLKSPGYLRRFIVNQTPVENPLFKKEGKTCMKLILVFFLFFLSCEYLCIPFSSNSSFIITSLSFNFLLFLLFHLLQFYSFIFYLKPTSLSCPVSWGCRTHQLLLCRGVRPPPPMSALDMTLNNLMVRFH